MRFLLAVVGAFTILGSARATHLCGADIRYSQVGGLTYRVEVRLYHDQFAPQDAPEIILYYGDGAADTIPVQSDLSLGSSCCNGLRSYVGEHTFSGPGIYVPMAMARNRTIGIQNMQGSVDVPVCIDALLLVTAGLANSSPEFTNHSVLSYFNGNVLAHELQPFDPDGDSLSFELVGPRGEECAAIAGYVFPDDVVPGPYTASVNGDGVFQWDAPQLAGYYTIAIRCQEWRAGEMIGAVTRDMMLCVPAELTAVPEVDRSPPTIIQTSLDGPVTLRTNRRSPTEIVILDMRGALMERMRPIGTTTVLNTEAMGTGIYSVHVVGAEGLTTVGRFVVAR